VPRVTLFHLSGDEPEAIISFYEEIFGWEFEKAQSPRPAWFIRTGDDTEPGINGMLHTRERDATVVNTIEVDDMESAVAQIEKRGGRILDRRKIPGAGELSLFRDPENNEFQLRRPPESKEI
jgi:predicted enzyme related to lactoylglutathione lyase